MTPVVQFRIVLAIFIVWTLVLGLIAIRPVSTRRLGWLLLLPLILFIRRNPFSGSVLDASIFFVLVWALALLVGLSSPLMWWLGQPSSAVAVLSLALLAVPSLLKGAVPMRRGVGVVLAGLFGPWGHWYIEGGGGWVVAVWASAFVTGLIIQLVRIGWHGATVLQLPDFPSLWLGWPGAALHVVSALLMYLRFRMSGAEDPQ